MNDAQQMWDRIAFDFATLVEPVTLLLARSLIAALQLERAEALLEVGGGAGGGALVVREQLPAGARQVCSDFSSRMLQMARERLPERVPVVAAAAESLPFADGAFDRYLANLILMLVDRTDPALEEAARVLRPGGLAAWSVWGRPENSPMFTLVPRAAERVGVTLPARRSNFHLNDREALCERVRRAGFRSTIAWFQPAVVPVRSGEDYVALIEKASASFRGLMHELPAEQAAALRGAVVGLADQTLAAGHPIALEALVVVAQR